VETWRNHKRAEAKIKVAEIEKLEGEIAKEMADIDELMVSLSCAWHGTSFTQTLNPKPGQLRLGHATGSHAPHSLILIHLKYATGTINDATGTI